MKRLALFLAALAVAFAPLAEAAPKSHAPHLQPPVPGPTERIGATRAAFPTTYFGGYTATYLGMSRTVHVATSNCGYMRLGYANFIKGSNYPEQGTGTGITHTIRAAIEYPAGGSTATRVTFSGYASGGDMTTGRMNTMSALGVVNRTSPSGIIWSDLIKLPVPIPSGATFYIRGYDINSALTYTTIPSNSTSGDLYNAGLQASFTGADWTQATTNPANNSGATVFHPPAIILCVGATNALTVAGDSIVYGVAGGTLTMTDNNMKNGIVYASAPSTIGFVNLGIPGATASGGGSDWAVEAPNDASLLRYGTTEIYELGINDASASASAATMETNAQNYSTNYMQYAVKKFILTLTPSTTSTDNWCTQGNQSGSLLANGTVSSAARNAYNTWVRSTHTGYDGYFDVAAGVEFSQNSNTWITAQCRTLTDVGINSGSSSFTVSAGEVGPSDVGYGIFIAGAGISGAVYKGNITAVTPTNCTTACTGGTINAGANAANSVTNATTQVGTCTLDGTHPTPACHVLGSNQINFTLVQ